MDTSALWLTVFFEAPFWVGMFERVSDGRYEVCKIMFGSEPKDCEIYEFLRQNWRGMPFSPPVKAGESQVKQTNPKRMQRDIRKLVHAHGVGTKAQQAYKLQQEQIKEHRAAYSRQQRETERELRFSLRQEKRKEKHRGH